MLLSTSWLQQLRVQLQAHHRRNHSSWLSNLEAIPSHRVRGSQMSSSEKHFANDLQLGQTLGREILSHVTATQVVWSTLARSRRP